MKVVFTNSVTKEVRKIKNGKIQRQIKKAIFLLKEIDSVRNVPSIVKMPGQKTAYRMRIGNYRLGFFLKKDTIELARLLKRNDIYKVFT